MLKRFYLRRRILHLLFAVLPEYFANNVRITRSEPSQLVVTEIVDDGKATKRPKY